MANDTKYRVIQKRGGFMGDYIEDFNILGEARWQKEYVERTCEKIYKKNKVKIYEVTLVEKVKEIK